MAFNLEDRVALVKDVEEGKVSFYGIKKILEDGYIVGKCSCRPDLYFKVTEEEILPYFTAKDMIAKKSFE